MRTRLLILAAILAAVAVPSAQSTSAKATADKSDLDAFMSQVLARRDDNWTKLQQYILNEEETFQVTGTDSRRLYGWRREYLWFPRDGLFIRSPLKADGVTISEADRRKAEERWVKQEQERQKRRGERDEGVAKGAGDPEPSLADLVDTNTNEPRFISTAYFMKFKFEPGHYALAGRETLLGRNVLRIEYYPARLFAENDNDKNNADNKAGKARAKDDEDVRIERQMNKVSLVTLWVEPAAHQILQYEFRNIDFDFLPGRSLVRLDDLRASMRMGQAFPDVWLPDTIAMRFAMTLAIGTVDARYDVQYHDYREAAVRTRVR